MEESKLVTIEDVCKSGSSNVSQNKLENIEGIYPIYGASGLIKNVDFYHQENPYLSIVKDGSGYGRITKMPEKTSVIGTLQYLLPKDNILLDYLYYGMQSIDFKKYVSGAAIPHIYFKDYKKEPILLRPIKEQRTIVAKLDQAFAAIDQAKANIQKNIANAKELFQSKLNQIFSQKGEHYTNWQWIQLGKICKTGAGGTPLKSKKEYYENGDIPWLLSGEVNNRNITSSRNFITQKGLDNSSAKLFPKDSVLVAMYGATAGQVGILRFESASNQAVCAIFPNENYLTDFLYYTFQFKKNELIGKAVGNAQPNISQIKIKETEVPLLELEEQQQIVTQLDQLQEQTNLLVTKYQQKLANLEELRKSILEKAFKGELT